MTPQPGDYGVVRTGGFMGACIRLATRSPANHAFVYVGDGLIVEADPAGAREVPLTTYPRVRWSSYPLTVSQRRVVVAASLAMVGRPYGFVDIVALGFAAFGITNRWISARLSAGHAVICSQLVAIAYGAAGVVLSPKPVAAVTPADLLVDDDGL